MMPFYALSPLINAVSTTIIGAFVLFSNPKSKLNRSFFYFSLSILVWSYSYFFWQKAGSQESALFICRLLMLGAIFIPATYFALNVTLAEQNRRYRTSIITFYVVSFVLAILDCSPLIVKGVKDKLFFHNWPIAGNAYFLFLLYFAIVMAYSLIILHKAFNTSSAVKRNQIKYLIWGNWIAFLGSFTNFPLWYDIPIPPVGNILLTVYVAMVAYAIYKYHLMDIRVAITRAGIFAVVYIFVLGIPFWIGHRFIDQRSWWYVPIAAAVFLASIGPLLYHYLRKKADNILLAQQKHYQNILLSASEGMASEHNVDRLLKLIVYIIKSEVRAQFAGLFLNNPDRRSFELRSVRDRGSLDNSLRIDKDHPLISYLKEYRNPCTSEELPETAKAAFGPRHKVELIVPLSVQDKLSGFLVLGRKLDKSVYTEDDMRVFKTLSNQAALAIENCLYMEESRKAQERIFAAEKLASIGGMAEGIAHQLSNRLYQFALNSDAIEMHVERFEKEGSDIVQKYPMLKDMMADLKKITGMIAGNVERTNNVVKGIMNYSKIEVSQREFSSFPLHDIVNPAVELLKIKHNVQQFPLAVEVEGCDGQLRGVKAQLMEALYNILDNAYEAVKEKKEYLKEQGTGGYIPSIRIQISKGDAETARILKITDNGIGVREENKPKIFAPFYTTKSSKKSGAGIGMYIVKRMVEETHKGKISVESEYGKGTLFKIEL